MFEHTCHGILFVVMRVFKLKIQNDSKGYLKEFQMAFEIKTNKRKQKKRKREKLSLHCFWPEGPLLPHLPRPNGQPSRAAAAPEPSSPFPSLPLLIWAEPVLPLLRPARARAIGPLSQQTDAPPSLFSR